MIRTLPILIIFLATFIFSCEEEDPLTESELLIGNWNWERTTGGFVNINVTPQSSGVTQSIAFHDDGLYYNYVDGDIVQFGNYTVTFEESVLNDDPVFMVRFDGVFNGLAITEINKNKLILTQECIDCFIYEFSR